MLTSAAAGLQHAVIRQEFELQRLRLDLQRVEERMERKERVLRSCKRHKRTQWNFLEALISYNRNTSWFADTKCKTMCLKKKVSSNDCKLLCEVKAPPSIYWHGDILKGNHTNDTTKLEAQRFQNVLKRQNISDLDLCLSKVTRLKQDIKTQPD